MVAGSRSGAPPLIGRDGEITELRDLLSEYALITLVGPGGVGKTSVAMRLAHDADQSERFEGGVYIAELAGVRDEDDVEGLVARELGAASLEAFRLRSVGAPILVVLDNCETASSPSRAIAAALVDAPSDITVMATSRSPLYALGERIVPIRPLAVDTGHPEAIVAGDEHRSAAEQLFLQRAGEAGARWEHTPDNLVAVKKLVGRLNGLPLAIELAAARSRVLGPVELRDRLDQQLDVLVRTGRDGERHHNLRAVIASSYEPLDDTLQHALRSLSFIATSFDLQLAHAVVGADSSDLDTLDAIEQLVAASLIDARIVDGGNTEFRLLDSIRAFARDQVTSDDEWRELGERYVDAVAERSATIVAAALESFSGEAMNAIGDVFSHLVNAISWCLDHDPSPARTYQMMLLFFGPTGATPEIAELARRVRERWDEPAPLQAEAYAVMGSLTYRVGRYDDGATLAKRAAEHPDATDMARFMGRRTLGYEAATRRDNATALAHVDVAVPLGPAFSASFGREIRISRAILEWNPANSPAALAALEAVLDEATEAQEWVNVVWARVAMSFHHRLLGRASDSIVVLEPAMDAAERAGMPWTFIAAHHNMAMSQALAAGWEAASAHFRRALDAAVGVGDIESTTVILTTAAGAAAHLGHGEVADNLWSAIPAHPGISVPASPFEQAEQELRDRRGDPPGGHIAELVRSARAILGSGASSRESTPSAPSGALRSSQVVAFAGGFELDFDMCELRRDGERIAIEPQVYDVLAHLVERRGQVVHKHELLDEVWGDRFVSEGALSSRISAARKATGDDGTAQRVIRTVHGKGFSFIASIET